MTFKELSAILDDNKISKSAYTLDLLKEPLRSDVGTCIIGDSNTGFSVFFQERAEIDFVGEFDNEHDACMGFLKNMASFKAYKQLQKYIS